MTDLRHMSAYILAEMGVDIESISHILGHTKLSSTIAFCCDFPDENNELLENLTLSQYDQIFDALLENEDLKTIKKIIGK